MARKKIIYPLGDKSFYDERGALRLISTGTCTYVEGDPKINPNSRVDTIVVLDAKTLKEITRFKTYSLLNANGSLTFIDLEDIVPLKNVFVMIESATLDKTDAYKTFVYNYKGKVLESSVFSPEKYNRKEYVASIKEKYKNYAADNSKNCAPKKSKN